MKEATMDSSIPIPQQFFKVVSEIIDEHIKLKSDFKDAEESIPITKSRSYMEPCCGVVFSGKPPSWESTQSDDEVSRKSTTAHISTPPRNWWELWRQFRGAWESDNSTSSSEDLISAGSGQLDAEADVADQSSSPGIPKVSPDNEDDNDTEELLTSYGINDDNVDRFTKLRNLKLLLEKMEAMRNKRKLSANTGLAKAGSNEDNSSVSTPSNDVESNSSVSPPSNDVESNSSLSPSSTKPGEIRVKSRIPDSSETESCSDVDVDAEVTQIQNFLTRRRLRLGKDEFDRIVDSTAGLRSTQDILWNIDNNSATKGTGTGQSSLSWRRFIPNVVLRAFQKSTNTTTTTSNTAKPPVLRSLVSGWNKLKFHKGAPVAPVEYVLGVDDNPVENDVEETPTESAKDTEP